MKLATRTFALTLALALAALAAPALADSHMEKEKTAAAKSSGGDVAAQLEAHERKIWDALKAKDSKAFLALVDANAWAIDPAGMMPASKFVETLPDVEFRSIEATGFRATMLTKDVYVLTCTSTVDGSFKGQPYPSGPWYNSTIYVKKGKTWMPVFHQETLAMPGPSAGGH